jgi:hypothetical protein
VWATTPEEARDAIFATMGEIHQRAVDAHTAAIETRGDGRAVTARRPRGRLPDAVVGSGETERTRT